MEMILVHFLLVACIAGIACLIPRASIAPFLHLKAHRLRAGYEAARATHQKEIWPILAKRYRPALIDATVHANSLISCIAHDLELQPYAYLEGHGRS